MPLKLPRQMLGVEVEITITWPEDDVRVNHENGSFSHFKKVRSFSFWVRQSRPTDQHYSQAMKVFGNMYALNYAERWGDRTHLRLCNIERVQGMHTDNNGIVWERVWNAEIPRGASAKINEAVLALIAEVATPINLQAAREAQIADELTASKAKIRNIRNDLHKAEEAVELLETFDYSKVEEIPVAK